MGFSVLGFLIVVNQTDGGASIPGGIFGILLGAAFLIAACLHLKRQIQGGFRVEEVPATEMNGRPPFRPDRGFSSGVTHNVSQRFLI